nr:GyrI-like domain-containing protein [Ferrovum sp.]
MGKVDLKKDSEGKCAQILHIGPFSEEGPTIEKLHQFIDSRSRRGGKHHEIYLSDIRKADPSKWKTIIRQPMPLLSRR